MAIAVRWTGMKTFVATETRVQLHEWLAIATGSLVQAALLVFVWVLNKDLLAPALIGALIYSTFLIGQRVLNEAAYIRIDHKLNELYHASPMTPESYFLGMSIGILIAYLPPIVILTLLLEIVRPLDLATLAALAATLLAVWAFSSTLGYVISTLFKDMKTIWPYSSLLTNLFGIVPPVFYGIHFIDPALRSIVLVVPTSSAVALVEGVAGMESLTSGEYLLAGVSLAVEALVLLAFGLYWARRTAREV